MDTSPPLLSRHDGPVATLTLNRPGTRNALNRELVRELGAALGEIASDPEVRVIVLTGAGESFCSGADLKSAMMENQGADMGERIDEFHVLIKTITHAPKPVIAAVDGAAVGFGADLALSCDLRLLSNRGYLQEKFVRIGLMPDGGGSFWLPRLVGPGRALEYLMLGTKIDAALALEIGLANRVVVPEALAATAAELAAELAKGPPLALRAIKTAVRESAKGGIDEALARERAGQLSLLASQDLVEGVMAWSQHRDPDFKGR